MAAKLPRDVLRWLQSLELTWPVKQPKWDVSNGYAIAEILSFYFNKDIDLHNYINGTSLDIKQKNWTLLRNFMKKQSIKIPEPIIKAAMHTKDGAAELLLINLYSILTSHRVQRLDTDLPAGDFTDASYQARLPLHARTTATLNVKNNIKCMEPDDEPNELTNQRKAQELLGQHVRRRIDERIATPERFHMGRTLAEIAVRRPPPNARGTSSSNSALGLHTQHTSSNLTGTGLGSSGGGSGSGLGSSGAPMPGTMPSTAGEIVESVPPTAPSLFSLPQTAGQPSARAVQDERVSARDGSSSGLAGAKSGPNKPSRMGSTIGTGSRSGAIPELQVRQSIKPVPNLVAGQL